MPENGKGGDLKYGLVRISNCLKEGSGSFGIVDFFEWSDATLLFSIKNQTLWFNFLMVT